MEIHFLTWLNISQNALNLFFQNSNYKVLYEKNALRFNFGPRKVFRLENMHFHFHAFIPLNNSGLGRNSFSDITYLQEGPIFKLFIVELNEWPCWQQTLPDATPSDSSTVTITLDPNTNLKSFRGFSHMMLANKWGKRGESCQFISEFLEIDEER